MLCQLFNQNQTFYVRLRIPRHQDPYRELHRLRARCPTIYVGIGVFLVTSLLFKNHRYRWLIALFTVIAAASMGEVLDRHDQLIIDKHWYWQGSVHDIVNTCFFPTLFTLILTFTHFFERNFERNIAQTHGSKR